MFMRVPHHFSCVLSEISGSGMRRQACFRCHAGASIGAEGQEPILRPEARRIRCRFHPNRAAYPDGARAQVVPVSFSPGSGLEAMLPQIGDDARQFLSRGVSHRTEARESLPGVRALCSVSPGRVFPIFDHARTGRDAATATAYARERDSIPTGRGCR